jgi:hypothetical protein
MKRVIYFELPGHTADNLGMGLGISFFIQSSSGWCIDRTGVK